MNEKEDGGPAFPTENAKQNGPYSFHYEGMALRDYFAAKAMQGMLANPELLEVVTRGEIVDGSAAERCAKRVFQWADAMLKERSK